MAMVVSALLACEMDGISPRRCAIVKAVSEPEDRYSDVPAAGVPSLKKMYACSESI